MARSETSQDLSIDALRCELDSIIAERRRIGDRLLQSTRAERKAVLVEHRRIKSQEYDLSLQIAELEAAAIAPGKTSQAVRRAIARVARMRSRLDHGDWLVWTRSIWTFKDMESRAKTGSHPAQFSAKVPERVIRMFSFSGDTVLDPFIGSGTTCVSAISLGRRAIGVDINPQYIELAKRRVSESGGDDPDDANDRLDCQLTVGDARTLCFLDDSSVQLIVTHPPYWNAVRISDLADDISNCDDDSYPKFLENMRLVLAECLRVLQPDRVAAFMVGDITRKIGGVTRLFPLHSDLLALAQHVGWIPWDVYIVETKMRNSGGMPMMGSYPYPHKLFAQFAHNYLLILRKPAE